MEQYMKIFSSTFFGIHILRLVSAVLILIWVICTRKKAGEKFVCVLHRFTGKTASLIDDQVAILLRSPFIFFYIVLGVWTATKVLILPKMTEIVVDRLTATMVLFAILWSCYRATDVMELFIKSINVRTQGKIDHMLIVLIRNGLKVMIIVFGVMSILQQWYSNVTGLLTGLGLGGLAFALAAKDTAANLFGSITILIDRPFTIGDWILTPHVEGTVEDIGFRSTRIRTFTQAVVTIPNSVMSNDPITNWSRMGKRRLQFRFVLMHDSPQERIMECINQLRVLLEKHPGIYSDSAMVFLEKLGESGYEILVSLFTYTTQWKEYLQVQEEIILSVLDIVSSMQLELAFPLRPREILTKIG